MFNFLNKIKSWFVGDSDRTQQPVAPYKIEAPAVTVQAEKPAAKQPVQNQQSQKQKKPAQPKQGGNKPRGRKPKTKQSN